MHKRFFAIAALSFACGSSEPPVAAPGAPIGPPRAEPDDIFGQAAPAPPRTGFARLERATFNRLAARLNLPVFWERDADGDGELDPSEVLTLQFFPTAPVYVEDGAFTSELTSSYEALVAAESAQLPTGSDAERRRLVRAELDEAASVVIKTSLAGMSAEDLTFVGHMTEVAHLIDELYLEQKGVGKLAAAVAKDSESQSLFRRNRGPSCKTPRFEKEPGCSAIAGSPSVPVSVYPASLQADPDFCKKLEAHADAKKLLTPFSVVREQGGKLEAVGYDVAYGALMKRISAKLEQAARDLKDPKEKALVSYLRAAAKAFQTNKWEPADEAWAKMSSKSSRWYVRVGPDETYWEPCSQKAGFHLTFARINTSSVALMDKLTPLIQPMEDDIAKLLGDPYKARKVKFHLPDFIDIVLNAGDDRDAVGITGGQSLPNWGPVANQGRGRTVVMANLSSDADTTAVRRAKAESFLDKAAAARYVDDSGTGLLGTVLHEATHNLGPSHEYKFDGKKDDEAFGGELASMLEELKAQSGSYYLLSLIEAAKIIDQKEVEQSFVDNVVWSMNHIAKGMYSNGKRRPYSQLAAIHVGFFMDEKVLRWDPQATAANGKDKGAFSIDFSKIRPASEKLMKLVGSIKAKNDKVGALALADRYVEKGSIVPFAIITERALRYPQPNFVYAVTR